MAVLRMSTIILVAILAATAMACIAIISSNALKTDSEQSALTAFYTPPEFFETTPGTLLRLEALGTEVAGAHSYRMLYVTEDGQGNAAVASGMAFVPVQNATIPRPMVVWAHGTTGQGYSCAPSRSAEPLSQLSEFIPTAITRGWAVAAPDYLGLGTPGLEQYLLKEQEVRDTVNSIRALQSIPGSETGNNFAVFGHSQGGHTALWTGHLSKQFAPELNLVGVAASAPAAELTSIIDHQWNSVVGWVIGPEVMRSWPAGYPNLPVNSLLTKAAQNNYQRMAQECIANAAVEGQIRQELFNESFFVENPANNPIWALALADQTPPPFPANLPLMLVQGTADQVVLAGPNADLQESWCATGSTINALWLGGVDHLKAAQVAGPSVTAWLADRFAGETPPNTCNEPPPRSLITVQ